MSSGCTRSRRTSGSAARSASSADTTAVVKLGASRSNSAMNVPSTAGPMKAASLQPAACSASRCGSSESSPCSVKTTWKVCSVVLAAGDIAAGSALASLAGLAGVLQIQNGCEQRVVGPVLGQYMTPECPRPVSTRKPAASASWSAASTSFFGCFDRNGRTLLGKVNGESSRERFRDEARVVRAWPEVQVLARRLDVRVAHRFLHADDVGLADHRRAEGVAEVMEAGAARSPAAASARL